MPAEQAASGALGFVLEKMWFGLIEIFLGTWACDKVAVRQMNSGIRSLCMLVKFAMVDGYVQRGIEMQREALPL